MPDYGRENTYIAMAFDDLHDILEWLKAHNTIKER